MKIIRNIPGLVNILLSLPGLNGFKREIDKARQSGDVERERTYILKASEKWGSYLVKKFQINVNVHGRENLPDSGPVVYVCNHQGYADIPVICSVLNKFQFGFIAKDNLKQVPLYGVWMRRIRSVLIKRDDPRASLQAISEGIEYIEDGFSMLIFPEGTRSKTGQMNEFKMGALKLATKPGVPIVPMTINGSRDCFENQGYFKKCTIDLLIHPPIPTEGLSRAEEKALTGQVFQVVKDGLDELQAKKETVN